MARWVWLTSKLPDDLGSLYADVILHWHWIIFSWVQLFGGRKLDPNCILFFSPFLLWFSFNNRQINQGNTESKLCIGLQQTQKCANFQETHCRKLNWLNLCTHYSRFDPFKILRFNDTFNWNIGYIWRDYVVTSNQNHWIIPI